MKKLFTILCILICVYLIQLCYITLIVKFVDELNQVSEEVRWFTLSVFIAPVYEEVFYRYLPLTFAKRHFKQSIWLVAIFSSIVFGLAHGDVTNVLIQGFLGLTFSFVFLNFGLKYSILSHSLWNLGCYLNFI